MRLHGFESLIPSFVQGAFRHPRPSKSVPANEVIVSVHLQSDSMPLPAACDAAATFGGWYRCGFSDGCSIVLSPSCAQLQFTDANGGVLKQVRCVSVISHSEICHPIVDAPSFYICHTSLPRRRSPTSQLVCVSAVSARFLVFCHFLS